MIEPKYPGAFEQLVDLSSCWDEHALFENREAIMALSAKISRCHEHCCRFLGAAGSLLSDTYRIALEGTSVGQVIVSSILPPRMSSSPPSGPVKPSMPTILTSSQPSRWAAL